MLETQCKQRLLWDIWAAGLVKRWTFVDAQPTPRFICRPCGTRIVMRRLPSVKTLGLAVLSAAGTAIGYIQFATITRSQRKPARHALLTITCVTATLRQLAEESELWRELEHASISA